MKTTLPVALAVLGFVAPAVATAGANKTWVSGTGKDTGTCPISAPCASFQYAVNLTAAGGEVDVKDAGGYGILTITKAITIVADGVLASISVPSGGTGITVSAGVKDVVTLKGLTIDGHGIGQYGIKETQPSLLAIEDTTVQGLTGTGIAANLPTFDGYFGLDVAKSVIRNNNTGIQTSGTLNLGTNLIDSTISHNVVGFSNGVFHATINHCLFEYNTGKAIDNSAEILIINSQFSFNIGNNFGNNASSSGDNIFYDYAGASGSFNAYSKQ